MEIPGDISIYVQAKSRLMAVTFLVTTISTSTIAVESLEVKMVTEHNRIETAGLDTKRLKRAERAQTA